MNLKCVGVFIITFFALFDYGIAVNGRKSDLWPSINKSDLIFNPTIYLGYANNPFGPSSHIYHTTKTANITDQLYGTGASRTNAKPTLLKPSEISDSYKQNTVNREQRSKRGVIHLYNMVSCATGCNPLIYKGYGCYCGFLGSGYAVDGIDRCCKMHDWCYDTARCPMFLEYFVPYLWKCYRNKPLCAISLDDHGEMGTCAQRLCECDRALSHCLKKYPCPSSRALCRSSPWRLIQNALMVF